jgi:hypothetical protein
MRNAAGDSVEFGSDGHNDSYRSVAYAEVPPALSILRM